MGRPGVAQWAIATVVFVAIGLVGFVYGHIWSLGLLVALLIVIALLGGHTDESASDQTDSPGPDQEPARSQGKDRQGR